MEKKVKSVAFNEKKEWNDNRFDEYKYHFEDGSWGFAWHKEGGKHFNTGDVVNVEQKTGNNIKVSKLQDTPKPAHNGPRKGFDNAKGMRVGMAINNAIQLVCHGKIGIDQIKTYAKRIIEVAEELEGECE